MNVKITGNASATEASKYVEYLEEKHGRKLNSLAVSYTHLTLPTTERV